MALEHIRAVDQCQKVLENPGAPSQGSFRALRLAPSNTFMRCDTPRFAACILRFRSRALSQAK
jgi:hypothetical protein